MLYDWAAQPFFTLVTTFIFAPYFAAHVAPDPVSGQQTWAWAAGTAGMLIAICAPVFGALGDAAGARKPWIAGFSVLAIAGSLMLWFAVPGAEYAVAAAIIGFILATVGFECAASFNNAMMPDLVPRSELGRLSGAGWALGYAGGIVCLVIVLCFMSARPETGLTLLGIAPILGLDPATHAGDRATGPFTAIWYVVFVIPLFAFVPDAPHRRGAWRAVRANLADLGRRLKALPRRRSFFAYLVSSMLYRDGLNAVFVFGGIYAAGVLGMSIVQIGIFGILATFTGTAGAWFGGVMDQRFGPKTVVAWTCCLVIAAALAVISTEPGTVLFVIGVEAESAWPMITFYGAGGLIGAAAGALQAASRTLLVDHAAPGEAAEAFGLYALAGRATAFLGPYLVWYATAASGSQRMGVVPLVVLIAIGALGLFWVRPDAEPPATGDTVSAGSAASR